MIIVDAHLDLAYNVTRGRDPRMPAARQPMADREIATVGLPDLRAGGVGLICATIFCAPGNYGDRTGYTNSEEARAQALSQLAWYCSCVDEGVLQMAKSGTGFQPVSDTAGETPSHGLQTRATTSFILLLEGADAIRTPDDLPEWFDAGLRIVGLAWKATRYAGGTGVPGPLTPEGRALVKHLDRLGIIHDTSHLAEQSFWDLMDLTDRPVIASHSNCRAIVGEGDRHLSDEMIRAIVHRGGVIGMNFFDKFLLPKNDYGKRRATLADVVNHVKHICDLAGSANHVGLGTDMDGGLGREQIPVEIRTSSDLPRVAEALARAGFSDSDIEGVMGGNWLRYFAAALPRDKAPD
ncbi:MAG TPA: membrane dipeptidase [Tepidisphaeraceae bacterium]|jgi:membrane dipeptidase